MAEIKVTSGELRRIAQELRQLNNQFNSSVEEMTSTEQQLMGMWDGEAKDTFHNAYNNDKGQMDVFYQTIEKYCQTLEANADKYERAEQQNLNTASNRTYR